MPKRTFGLAGALALVCQQVHQQQVDRLEGFDHPPFQMEATVEDDVRIIQQVDVARTRLVEMRINPRTHQRGDFDPVTADVTDEVRDHADCCRDLDLVSRIGRRSASLGLDQWYLPQRCPDHHNSRHRRDQQRRDPSPAGTRC